MRYALFIGCTVAYKLPHIEAATRHVMKALGIYPIYHQIITKPMDLGTVKKKIDTLEYRSRKECLDDIQLVWENAMKFNAKGHFVL